MHPLIEIYGQYYSSYHILFFISIFASVLMFFALSFGIRSFLDKVYFCSVCFIFGILGSKLFFFIEDPNLAIEELFNLKSGFVYYGSLFGVILAVALINYRNTSQLKLDFALLSISSALGMFIGKIGCFLAGCCYGWPTDSKLGVFFTQPNTSAYHISHARFPIQLLDSLSNLGLLVILLVIFKIKQQRELVILTFLIVYPITRFFTEFLRADISRGFVFQDTLSLSQLYSVVIFISTIIYIIFSSFMKKRQTD